MKRFITAVALIIASISAYAEDPILIFMDDPTARPTVESLEEDSQVKSNSSYDADLIYEKIGDDGTEPTFPGGEGALMRYVANHLRYPSLAQENGTQGKVIVMFVVTKTGTIGQVKVVRGVDSDLDKEAVRIAKSLPKFNPAKINGMPVNCWYTLPVTFKLQGM